MSKGVQEKGKYRIAWLERETDKGIKDEKKKESDWRESTGWGGTVNMVAD